MYSGSSIKQGEMHAVVYATGVNTFFGKAAHLVVTTESQVCVHIPRNFYFSFNALTTILVVRAIFKSY